MSYWHMGKAALFSGASASYKVEKRYLRKNGDEIWVSLTCSSVPGAEGKPRGFAVVVENIHEKKLQALALQALSTNLNAQSFLMNVTRTLATLLHADYAFVTATPGEPDQPVLTRAFWAQGAFEPDFHCQLEGTPCQALLDQWADGQGAGNGSATLVITNGLQQKFPGHARLSFMGVQSYAGIVLRGADGHALGTLALMSRQTLRHVETIMNLMELFATRVGSEIEIEYEHRKFQDLFDSSPNAILVLDANHGIRLANPASAALFGWPHQTLLTLRAADLFMQDFNALSTSHGHGQTSASSARSILQMRATRRDGSDFPVEVHLGTLVTGAGAMQIANIVDITERKRLQDRQLQINRELEAKVKMRTSEILAVNNALIDKEAEISSVLEHMVDSVVVIDSAGTIQSANPATTRIFGYQLDELVGKNASLLMPGPDADAHDQHMRRYMQGGAPRIIGIGREVCGRRKDGSEFPLELTISEMKANGARMFTGIMRDVTERKRALEALIAARDAAEAANRAKSAFLATMSHEIRTPMNGVVGMADILEMGALSRDQLENVRTIGESALALLRIVDEVLDFSKIEAGEMEVEHAPFDVAVVVEGVCDALGPMALKNRVELLLFTDPAIPPTLLGDAFRLRQILLNLVGNAIKFSAGRESVPGLVSVRAVLTGLESGRAMLELRIADNGIGMNPQTVSGLFEPFTQADNSTTRRFGGTGLGLSIAQRLAQLMGGSILVNSEPGKGSLFVVALAPERVNAKLAISRVPVLAGLECLLVGAAGRLGDDLDAYLTADGAITTRASDLAAACAWVGSHPSGMWVIVIDDSKQAFDQLRSCARPAGADIRIVSIERGQRRHPRVMASNLVCLDANSMHRDVFLEAVALAAGRCLARPAERQLDDANIASPPEPDGGPAQRNSRILIAEDNELNRKVLLKQLAILNVSADVANDGRAALAMWQRGNYALLLTDLHMPEMDGYDLTRAIRAAEAGAHRIPIIALTANAVQGEGQRCSAIGMDDYFTKPVQLKSLQAMLHRWLATSAAETRGEPLPPASTCHDGSVLDVAVLKALVGDNPADIRDFLDAFGASLIRAATEIRVAYGAGQIAAVGASAHRLKSSAHSVGALSLGALCDRLESAAKESGSAVAEILPQFATEVAAVQAFLELRKT